MQSHQTRTIYKDTSEKKRATHEQLQQSEQTLEEAKQCGEKSAPTRKTENYEKKKKRCEKGSRGARRRTSWNEEEEILDKNIQNK